jgi:FkbM family methyltransferase
LLAWLPPSQPSLEIRYDMPVQRNAKTTDPASNAALADIERRVGALERALAGRIPNSTPEWAEPRWYESPVQLALAKLLRLGDLGFDVGANLGIISAMMGAAVGPYGRVAAFEASPRTLGQLHANLNNSNAFNVTVVHAAVAETSGEFLPIFYGPDTPADTIMKRDERDPDAVVRSLALDDYVERLGTAPRVVKIDIEGAELLALQGFRRTLARARPALVIETFSLDLALDELLQSLGYDLCLDVNTFAPFDKRTQTEPYLCNLLYLHERDDRGNPFRSISRSALAQYAAGDLVTRAEGLFLDLGELPAGFYVLHFDFGPEAAQVEDGTELRIESPGRLHSMYVAPLWHIALACRAIPFELARPIPVSACFKRVAPERVPEVLPALRLERLGL